MNPGTCAGFVRGTVVAKSRRVRPFSTFAFASLTLLAAATGCAVKDSAGNGQNSALHFDAGDHALAVGVPALVRVNRPKQGVHLCIKGCVDVDPNSFSLDEATCDDGACEIVPATGGLGVVARREGSFTLRVKGRDGSTPIEDAFVLTAKTPAALVLLPSMRPYDTDGILGIAPGLQVGFDTAVRTASGEPLAHDESFVREEASGAIALVEAEPNGTPAHAFVAKSAGMGRIVLTLGPLRADTAIAVADPEAPHASLELVRYSEDRSSTTPVRDSLVLEPSAHPTFALIARDARGQSYFTGARYVATKSEPLVSSFPSLASPVFVLRPYEDVPDTFVAAFGGQRVSLRVDVAKTER